jgi:translation initiation factor 1
LLTVYLAPDDDRRIWFREPARVGSLYTTGVDSNVRVVYDSDRGRVDGCPTCGRTADACRCRRAPQRTAARTPVGSKDGGLRVWRDSKRRRGKTVTVIAGVPGGPPALAELAGVLKRHCGSGGTVQDDGTIEVQGDHRERVVEKLQALGYRVKLAWG